MTNKDSFDKLFEDEFGLGEGYYKTEPTGNGRYPSQMQWFTFLELVKEMRSEQKDVRTMFDFKTEEEFDAWAEDSYNLQCALEFRVDNMIKELFE